MRKYLLMLSVALGVSVGSNIHVSANSTYEVKMPEQSLTKTMAIEEFSQEIRELNQSEIDKLPNDEQQDAITKVLEVIAEINATEIDNITQMKAESLDEVVNANGKVLIPGWINYGDILITLDAKTLGWKHGHAGIVDYYKNYVIEANPGTGVVRTASYITYWTNKVRTDELYVGGATQDKYSKAVDFARAKEGTPYKISLLNDTKNTYCSKLVYQAWLSAGYNVGNSYTDSAWAEGFVGVTPKQILWDDNVFLYQKLN